MRTAAILAGMLLFAVVVPRAEAHAFLGHSEPKAGSTVTNSPAKVKIWFTENLESAFSSVQVENDKGRQVNKNNSQLNPSDKKLLEVSLPKLPPGTYKVVWNVVSTDTHRTQGHFRFTIK